LCRKVDDDIGTCLFVEAFNGPHLNQVIVLLPRDKEFLAPLLLEFLHDKRAEKASPAGD